MMTTGELRQQFRGVYLLHTRHAVFLLSLLLSFGAVNAPLFGQTTKSTKKTSAVTPPKWYTNLPKDTANLVGRGKGEAKDQQLAIDKAVLTAREDIVATIEKQWTALVQAIKNEGFTVNDPPIESLTLKGSKTTKQKASKSKKVWTAFVLVSYPNSSVPSLLLERVHQNQQWYLQVKDSKAIRRLESAAR